MRVDMGNKMGEFADEDTSSWVGSWKIKKTTSVSGGGLLV